MRNLVIVPINQMLHTLGKESLLYRSKEHEKRRWTFTSCAIFLEKILDVVAPTTNFPRQCFCRLIAHQIKEIDRAMSYESFNNLSKYAGKTFSYLIEWNLYTLKLLEIALNWYYLHLRWSHIMFSIYSSKNDILLFEIAINFSIIS